MKRYGFEWEQKGTHEEHLSDYDYKKKMRAAEVAELKEENQQLRAENKDFAFLRKMFGKDRIDDLVKEARELQQQKQRKRNKSYERGYGL